MTEGDFDASQISYNDIVLTSIDVTYAPTDEHPKRVTFSDNTEADLEDEDAVFLCNIREVNRKGKGYDTIIDFKADIMTIDEVIEKLGREMNGEKKKALFVIHGFNTQASYHLASCQFHKPRFERLILIPILWPSKGKAMPWDYIGDRGSSKAAGKALKSMKGHLNKLRANGISSSIVANSMGNRCFRNFADPDINFDNIFMVAADVDCRIFYESYINDGKEEWRQHGLNIKKMLTDEKGKIHVLYNSSDKRLFESCLINCGNRLGKAGVNLNLVHRDLKKNIVTIDVAENGIHHKCMLYEDVQEHCYSFYDMAVQYYEEHA